MIPPIDDPVLSSNPKFAALHTTLTATILNPSGSTKKHPAQKERDAVSEALKAARIRAAKTRLLCTSLDSLDLSPPAITSSTKTSKVQPPQSLPIELVELILLLSSRLSSPTPLTAPQVQLLESTSQWLSLPTHLPTIGSLISAHLHNQALALTRIQTPQTNASFLHRSIPKLSSRAEVLKQEIVGKKDDLSRRRMELVSKTGMLLTLYHLCTSLIIQILESSKHGSLSRHIKAKAEYLGARGKELRYEVEEKKSKGERMVYTEDVKQALGNYMKELRDGIERLRERRRDAERTLWGYGVGRKQGEGGEEKERTMKEIARVYGELIKEVKEVGKDVERLRGR